MPVGRSWARVWVRMPFLVRDRWLPIVKISVGHVSTASWLVSQHHRDRCSKKPARCLGIQRRHMGKKRISMTFKPQWHVNFCRAFWRNDWILYPILSFRAYEVREGREKNGLTCSSKKTNVECAWGDGKMTFSSIKYNSLNNAALYLKMHGSRPRNTSVIMATDSVFYSSTSGFASLEREDRVEEDKSFQRFDKRLKRIRVWFLHRFLWRQIRYTFGAKWQLLPQRWAQASMYHTALSSFLLVSPLGKQMACIRN